MICFFNRLPQPPPAAATPPPSAPYTKAQQHQNLSDPACPDQTKPSGTIRAGIWGTNPPPGGRGQVGGNRRWKMLRRALKRVSQDKSRSDACRYKRPTRACLTSAPATAEMGCCQSGSVISPVIYSGTALINLSY